MGVNVASDWAGVVRLAAVWLRRWRPIC